MSVVPRINADAEYPCTICGTLGSVVRDAPNLGDKKIKCGDLRCSYVYTAKDSLAAKEAGVIPDGPRVSEESPKIDHGDRGEPATQSVTNRSVANDSAAGRKAPRTPSFVILSKDRDESEFCTKKNLKERVILWTAQEKKFDVFELTPKKVQAKLSIQ